ncbi:MAG: FtsX-like permease family protein, partial [Lachnospiraceae bacterium]|nr:FtsX-like permease family protein [Lachnospiraceae bacterium]
AGMRGMLFVVILLGVSLTVIGMISNQLIGFEGRKRECAVLVSTAMERGEVAKMFVFESMISSGIALFISLPVAFLAFLPFKRLMSLFTGNFLVHYDVKAYVLFLLLLWLIFTLVSLFPIRSLRKMNVAIQLKYE